MVMSADLNMLIGISFPLSVSLSLRNLIKPGEDDGSEEWGSESADRRHCTSVQTEQSKNSVSMASLVMKKDGSKFIMTPLFR